MQQLGSALGVAVTGVIFFGEIGYGVTTAFEVCLVDWPCCRWGLRRSRDFGVVNLGHSMAEENSGGRV